jgi:putative oxidoreductase
LADGNTTDAGTGTMNPIDISLFIIQLTVGLTFAAHGAQKVFGWWGGPGLAGWDGAMDHMGFRPARLFALTSAFVELGGGLLLVFGLLTPIVAAVLLAQTVVIIGQVHWANGFFNARSGIEFPMLLGAGAAAIGLAGPGAMSVDAWIGVTLEPLTRLALVIAGIVVGFLVLAIPRLGTERAATNA